MKDEEWTMVDGTKIMVNDMDERHAKNCLRLMIKRANEHNARNAVLRISKDLDKVEFEEFIANEGDR